MDGISVGIALLVTIGLILVSLIACFSLCCCCCAIPIFRILWGMIFPKATFPQSTSTRGGNSREYELVSSANVESGYQHSDVPVGGDDDIVMAEAYLVPPLAEIVSVNEEQVAPQDSSRIHELQELTAQNKDGGFRDWWAAVLFIFNVIVIVYLAVQSIYLFKFPDSEESSEEQKDSHYHLKIIKMIALFTVLLTTFAAATGSWVLSFLIQHSENLIEMVMWGNIAMQTICAVFCIISFQLIGAIIFAVMAGLNYWYLISVRDQIPFSSSVLATACTAVKANYAGLVTTAFSALFLQMIWGLVWTVSFIGVMYANQDSDEVNRRLSDAFMLSPHTHSHTYPDNNHISRIASSFDANHNDDSNDDDDSNGSIVGLYYFLMFLSLYWGFQVMKAVVQTTVAGTLACWWFQPEREAPVSGSLFRSLTTSFGSLCLGSFIVAFVQALREVIHALRRQAERGNSRNRSALTACLLSMLEIVMGWLDEAVQYFNKYAYCYVAAYGVGFVSSGRLVSSLFYSRGWTAIINDNLISRALSCGVIALTVANMICGVLFSFIVDMAYAKSMNDIGTLALIGGLVGAVTGLVVGIVLTNALDSAVAMVYVCFAESPAALQKNHPEVYNVLRNKWDTMHPNTLAWAPTGNAVPCAMLRSSSATVTSAGGDVEWGGGYRGAPQSVYHPPTHASASGPPYHPHTSYTNGPVGLGQVGSGAYGVASAGYSGYGAAGSQDPNQPPHYQQKHSSGLHGQLPPSGLRHPASMYPSMGDSSRPTAAVASAVPSAPVHPNPYVPGNKNLPPPSAPPGH